MKKKDIIELVIALVVLGVAGYLIYGLVGPKPTASTSQSGSGATIVQVTPIDPNFSSTALQTITNHTQTQDFYTPPNLKQGLGNTAPFGQ